MTEVSCYLDSVRKYRGKEEYHTIPRITCPEYNLSIEGHGLIVKKMALLLAENKCPINRVYAVYRGETLAFTKTTLKQWVFQEDRRPEQLKKAKT